MSYQKLSEDLLAEGYTGVINEQVVKKLKDLIGSDAKGDSYNDLWAQYLTAEGYVGTVNDMLFAYLGDKGYKGTLSDRIAQSVLAGDYLAPYPVSLFTDGEQGAWYDPSDLTTMFQDAAGTTPVTAPSQPVGLVLDKSKGLQLGPELLPNGDFSNGTTGWSVPVGWAISGGEATASATSTSLKQTDNIASAGKSYKVEFDWTHNGGTLFVRIGTGTATTFSTSGRKSCVLRATNAAGVEFYGGSVSGVLDNITVKELAGNHAYQTTSASRPIYAVRPFGGVRNKLTYTENYADASWSKNEVNIISNAAIAPDGTITADSIIPTTAVSGHDVNKSVSLTSGSNVVHFVIAKANGYNFIRITEAVATGLNAYFDLQNGIATNISFTTAGIEALPDGWFLCWAQRDAYPSGTYGARFAISPDGTTVSFAGDGTSGIYAWGSQLEEGTEPTAYQKVVSQYEVTEAGVPDIHCLVFDGIDDSLVTSAIDFTASDEMSVFNGIQKIAGTQVQNVVELSPLWTVNNGAFGFFAPASTGSGIGYTSRGDVNSANVVSTGYTPPVKMAATGLSKISSDINIIREGGIQISSAANNQGLGNYGNHQMFIGRRNNADIPFNGEIYSLIVRAKLPSDAELNRAERYVAAKTGVTL